MGVDVGALAGLSAPDWRLVPELILRALSSALVGLIQGAGISGTFVSPDGKLPNASQDFVGQGAATRWAAVMAGLVIVVVIVVFGGVIGSLALPTLAGLLILVGIRSIKPEDLASVWHTGLLQKTALVVTFSLTMVLPLRYAVLVGVGLSVVLHVVRQSIQITIRQRVQDDQGYLIEQDPPAVLPGGEVVVLNPYGSLFFAAAPVFERALPAVNPPSRGCVVLLRLRGRTDLGSTLMDLPLRYAGELHNVESRLVIVSANERIQEQLVATGVAAAVGIQWHLRDRRPGRARNGPSAGSCQ